MYRIVLRLLAGSLFFFTNVFIYATASRVFGFEIPYWYILIGFLAFSYVLAGIGVRNYHHKIIDWFYLIASAWIGIMFLLFSASLVYVIGHTVTGKDSPLILAILLLSAIVASIYALIQGRLLTTREYTLPINGLTKPVRLVHLTDIHVGTVHKKDYLEKVVRETNSLSPELVLITGDLFDGSAPIDESILTPLNDLVAPSFFSNGNHEEYEGLKHVRDTVMNLKLRLLENQFAIHEELQIIGVNDRQSLSREQTLGSILGPLPYDGAKPTILMYHSPTEWDDALEHGADLMLSGHTHNGQIYPFTLLVKISFKYINGLYEKGGKYLHVSPGTGTWGPPMRLGSKNQITLITLVPVDSSS
jgi:predicted MPP superfamily phosphohydrolase